MGRPTPADWLTAAFWVAVLVVAPLAADLTLWRFGQPTVSYTTNRWCVSHPWLVAAGLAVALGLWWHCCLSNWPLGGD